MPDSWKIPKFTIDLSKSPQSRYAHVIPHFYDEIQDCSLPELIDAVIEALSGWGIWKMPQHCGSLYNAASSLG